MNSLFLFDMKKIVLLLLFLGMGSLFAQQITPKNAFLEKWENSKFYLSSIAKLMPEADFDYKPTQAQMSFREQLIHIKGNMDWLGNSYFGSPKKEKLDSTTDKATIIAELEASFNHVSEAVRAMPDEELESITPFFAGKKSRYQLLNLLQDHVTHHRGQLIVYLNLKGQKPPRYIGW
ncbi:MAG: DinB family protein [Flavobacteriaceae bacterium]|nr:DinB family protein [Flavobacteriaceae bacterium]